ncbi:TonB-dependent receptor [Thalassotalea sp. PP2-459]|uniref:TonB-dependent receptor n=1 Tax=Thalassotalea sp. PP2-459 TaxID=1742724 RepID=UPI0009456467|nr:TonB-dependent receptor [Thalassotalea sp. PP2-459]OKY27601.1 hypothetical protein BI291_08480 [Thalassotalea sp. PP2-459]
MNNIIAKSFKRSVTAAAVAVSLGVAMPAIADNSSGSIYGKAIEGKVVTIKNKSTGFKRDVTIGEDGRFNFSKLPTGSYEVSNGTDTFDIVVKIGQGSPVDFVEASERITVVGSAVAAIDTASVESTTVFTAEQVDLLPVARDLTSVALLAPSTTAGDSGFGNLASFGGSSVAENGYFINGFDVTNIRNFVAFAQLPYDAVGQQQVKTGGYGAEYGRSLGGVVSLVTKRGTNEWKFGGSVQWTPEEFREEGTDSVSRDPDMEYSTRYHAYRSANKYDYLDYNVYASGPIIEDKLFIYALAQGRQDQWNTFGRTTSLESKDNSPLYLAKIDWNITDDHLLEVTYIENKQTVDRTPYGHPDGVYYAREHGDKGETYSESQGGDVTIVNYTGYITDNLSVSALWGEMNSVAEWSRNPATAPGADCPLVYDRRDTPNSSQPIGCWDYVGGQTYVPEAGIKDDSDKRDSLRLGLEYVIGDHTIRAGYDQEKFTSTKRGETLTGGEYWRWHIAQDLGNGGQNVNGEFLDAGTTYLRHLIIDSNSASFEVENTAWYIEDSWQVNDEWLVYLGLRSEGFENRNGENVAFIKSDSELAPRLGFTWDINGEGERKLYGTAGRYYIPVASNSNIRAAGSETFIEDYYYADSANENPRTGAPDVVGGLIGQQNINSDGTAADPRTISATNLSPMFQDEYILGYQQQVEDWVYGVKAIYRDVKDGMDDYCSAQAFIDWADDNGYNNFDYHSLAGCFFMNPGRDISLAMDVENDGNFKEVTVPAEYFNLDTYQRTYKALEFTFEKPFADGWFVQGSYTLAKSEGNSEGYVNSTLQQADAGLTQDLDHYLFQTGAYGSLPNDRRHTLKVFGAYQVSDELSVSANLLVQSGRPRNCVGYIPLDQYREELGVDYGILSAYGDSAFFCGGEPTQRGDRGRTPWIKNVDLGLQYRPEWADGLTLKVDIRNVFNFQEVTEYNESGDDGSATAPVPNPNYGTPVNFQAPRRVMLTARYNF